METPRYMAVRDPERPGGPTELVDTEGRWTVPHDPTVMTVGGNSRWMRALAQHLTRTAVAFDAVVAATK